MSPPATLLPSLESTTTSSTPASAVLLVEDEEALADLLIRLLQRLNVEVLHAPDGASAIRLMEERHGHVALAFVDCNLPDMQGSQLCETLRERVPGLPLLLTSGRDQHGLEQGFAAGGPCSFLPKPYLPAEVMRRVGVLLPARE